MDKKPATIEELDEIIGFCVKENPAGFNMNKALEEAVEFQEVILKLQTKHPDNPKRPDKMEALKEFADLHYRGLIAIMTLFPEYNIDQIEDLMAEHEIMKLTKLIEYRKEGKYQGGL
jgi:hypothetical protein